LITAIIIIGFMGEKVRKRFGKRFGKMRLQYVEQRIQMGTAHAVLQAEGKVKGRFLVGSSDVIVQPSLWRKLWETRGFDAVVALRNEAHPERFGVAIVAGKKLMQVIEKPEREIGSSLVSAGSYAFSQRIFSALKKTKVSTRGEFEITDSINMLASKGRAGFVVYKGKCLDIGTLEELRNAGKT